MVNTSVNQSSSAATTEREGNMAAESCEPLLIACLFVESRMSDPVVLCVKSYFNESRGGEKTFRACLTFFWVNFKHINEDNQIVHH